MSANLIAIIIFGFGMALFIMYQLLKWIKVKKYVESVGLFLFIIGFIIIGYSGFTPGFEGIGNLGIGLYFLGGGCIWFLITFIVGKIKRTESD